MPTPDQKQPTVSRLAPPSSPRLRRVAVTIYCLVQELWIIARWLVLKAYALAMRLTRGRSQSTDFAVIQFGNRLFRPLIPYAVYQNYRTYVDNYASSLNTYLHLAPAQRWLIDKDIVDLGSGLGQFSELLHLYGARSVISAEYQLDKATWQKSNQDNLPIHVMVADAERLALKPNSVDTVFSHTVFEHIPDMVACLASVRAVLKPGGCALIGFNFYHHRGGHHLFPYIHFPWAPWVVDEKSLCDYWSQKLADAQSRGGGGFYPPGCRITSLSEGNEIHLNKITYSDFEKMVRESGLRISKRYTSEAIGRVVPLLRWVPGIRYFVTGSVFYVLHKPEH